MPRKGLDLGLFEGAEIVQVIEVPMEMGVDGLYAIHRRAVVDMRGGLCGLLHDLVWDAYRPWQRLCLQMLMDMQTRRVMNRAGLPPGIQEEDLWQMPKEPELGTLLEGMGTEETGVLVELGMIAALGMHDVVLDTMRRLGLMDRLDGEQRAEILRTRERSESFMRDGCPGCPNCQPEAYREDGTPRTVN